MSTNITNEPIFTELDFLRITRLNNGKIPLELKHLLSDALVSLGVLIAGILYLKFQWEWLDPVLSLIISVVIIFSALNLFKKTLHMMFDGVPESIELSKVYHYLKSIKGVSKVQDLHVWAMSTSNIALTAHLIVPEGNLNDAHMDEIHDALLDRFQIAHATIQITKAPMGTSCFNFLL